MADRKKSDVATVVDEPIDYPRSIFKALGDVREAPLGSLERMIKLADLEDLLYCWTTDEYKAGMSTRTDRMSMMVRSAVLWATLPEVAAGMKAPGSTERPVTMPERGARILV